MSKIFFVKSLVEKGNVRVRPLSGQKVFNPITGVEEEVIPTANIQCDKEIRTRYCLGTIFACYDLTKRGSHYTLPDKALHPVGLVPSEKEPLTPNKALLKAWKEFQEHGAFLTPEPEAPTDKEPKKEKTPTLFERIQKKIKMPTIEDDGFYVDRDVFYLLIRNIRLGQHTMLTGPTGAGKTELIDLVADKAKRKNIIKDMGAIQDPIAGLLGTHRLRKGQSIFDPADFVSEVQQSNTIITLDELSRAPVTTNNILFPCLDSRRELAISIADSKDDDERKVNLAKDLVFFATANIGVEYTGTGMLDRALVDRFFMVELDYMPKNIESQILVKRSHIDRHDADIICDYISRLRDLGKSGELSLGISTRYALQIASLVRDGLPITKSMEIVLYPLFEGTKSEGERSTVAATLTSK